MDGFAEIGGEFSEITKVDVAVEGKVAILPIAVRAKVRGELCEIAKIYSAIQIGIAFEICLCDEGCGTENFINVEIEVEAEWCVLSDNVVKEARDGIEVEYFKRFAGIGDVAVDEVDNEIAA